MRFAKLFDIDGHDVLFILSREDMDITGMCIYDGSDFTINFGQFQTTERLEAHFRSLGVDDGRLVLEQAKRADHQAAFVRSE